MDKHLWHQPILFNKTIHPSVHSSDCTNCRLMLCFLSFENFYLNLRFTRTTEEEKKREKTHIKSSIYMKLAWSGLTWLDSVRLVTVFFLSSFFSLHLSSLHFCTDLLAVGNGSRFLSCIVYDGSSPCDGPKESTSSQAHKQTCSHRTGSLFCTAGDGRSLQSQIINMHIRYHLAYTQINSNDKCIWITCTHTRTHTLSFDTKSDTIWTIPECHCNNVKKIRKDFHDLYVFTSTLLNLILSISLFPILSLSRRISFFGKVTQCINW